MSNVTNSAMIQQATSGFEGIKYSLIVISTVPVLAIYMALQKAFKGGVMVGSLKG